VQGFRGRQGPCEPIGRLPAFLCVCRATAAAYGHARFAALRQPLHPRPDLYRGAGLVDASMASSLAHVAQLWAPVSTRRQVGLRKSFGRSGNCPLPCMTFAEP
jgi:hypothetical protein